MPPPAVTAIVVVGSCLAAFIALKELVYEPYVAPGLESWIEQILAERRARRQARQSVAVPAQSSPLSGNSGARDVAGPGSKSSGVRTSFGFGRKRASVNRASDAGVGGIGDYDEGNDDDEGRDTVELERMVSREVDAWRTDVGSRDGSNTARLRQSAVEMSRRSTTIDGSVNAADLSVHPTNKADDPNIILFDASLPSTPGSSVFTRNMSSSSAISQGHLAAPRQPLAHRRTSSGGSNNSDGEALLELSPLSMSVSSHADRQAPHSETPLSPDVSSSELSDADMVSARSGDNVSEASWTDVHDLRSP